MLVSQIQSQKPICSWLVGIVVGPVSDDLPIHESWIGVFISKVCWGGLISCVISIIKLGFWKSGPIMTSPCIVANERIVTKSMHGCDCMVALASPKCGRRSGKNHITGAGIVLSWCWFCRDDPPTTRFKMRTVRIRGGFDIHVLIWPSVTPMMLLCSHRLGLQRPFGTWIGDFISQPCTESNLAWN